MVCNSCGEKPKNTAKDFTKAVVEINNPDKLVLFRKVVVPVSMGTEEDFPASVGKYYNVLLQYEANGDMYLYSSDGIPTKLSSDVSELQHELDQLGIKVDGEISARIAGDDALSGAIADEKTAREDADTALGNRITALDDSLATVAKTGNYNDLTNKPTIGNATLTIKRNNANVGTFTANATANKSIDISVPTKTSDITNDGSDGSSTYVESDDLATVATSGSYNDLTNKPTIGNATLTIKRNNTNAGTFTANATTNKSINIAVPTKTSDLTNDGADGTSTFVEADDLPVVDTAYSASSNNAIANSTVTNSLNRDVMTNLTLDTNPSTTTVNLNNTKTNLASPSSTTTTAISLPVASSTQAGVMNSSTFDAVTNNTNNINALLNGAVAVTGLPASPTQAQITSAWESETGLPSLINRASVYDVTNNKVWTYYTNDTTWHAASNTSQVTVNTFTNSSEGVIKGSTNTGQVFAENDGTGSVNGWDTLTGTVVNHTSKLATIEQGAEVNVQSNWTQTNTTADDYIKNKPANLVQDANYVHTDNNFTTTLKNKLNGIESGAEANVQADWSQSNTSADDYIKNKPTIPTVNNATLTIQKNGTNVQTFTANSSTNKTANITVPTAVSELTNDASYATTTQLNNGLATKQNTLTAGSNITITGNTISATDTTYTAGNAIDITNNVISANVYPADFFTNTTETVTAEGTDITMQGTALAPFVDVRTKGDTEQTTYTGKNLLLATSTGSPVYGILATNNSDGTVTLSGTGTENAVAPFSDTTLDLPAGTYTLSLTESLPVRTLLRDVVSAANTWVIEPGETSVTATTAATTKIRLWFYLANGVAMNQTVGFQLEAGETATAFEPYVGGTAAPNPEYPQEVKVVTGTQTVTVQGKNLMPYATADMTAGRQVSTNNLVLSANTYTISFDLESFTLGTNTTFRLYLRLNNSSNVTVSDLNILSIDSSTTIGRKSYTFTISENIGPATNSGFRIAQTQWDNGARAKITNIQIESGSTATAFQPYQSQNYEVNLGKNLFVAPSTPDYENTGTTYTKINDNSFSITVSPAATWKDDRFLVRGLKANTTYTFSAKFANTNSSITNNWFMIRDGGINGTVMQQGNINSSTSKTFTTTSNTTIAICLSATLGTAYENTMTVSDIQLEIGSAKSDFTPYFTPIELCKIGNYQDYIYKDGDDWYLHKATGKAELGSLTWGHGGTNQTGIYRKYTEGLNTTILPSANNAVFNGLCTHFGAVRSDSSGTYGTNTGISVGSTGTTFIYYSAYNTNADDTAFKTWLTNNNVVLYYALATPTDTQITDATLIEQLGALSNANSYRDVTYITTASDGYNLPMILTAEAFTNTLVGMTEVIGGKQRKLTAGENIAIDANNVISATDTTYTAGTGISITNGIISCTFADGDLEAY